ncbi:hypothetical protein EV368DRAFT_68460 [Lentinula lateritia]|nr:hypothetical protein EV368DRAFT_68460 [Lentinula lateritia]
MVYSCSVLTAVVAVGIASSALAVPLPSSGALGGTVTVEAPIIDARELELSVHKDNEWHPLMHFGGGQPINADNALLLGKENLDAEALVPIPIPVDVALEQHDHILDNYMGISQPDPMGILSKVEDQSLTLSLDVAGSAGGLSPIHIERRDLIAPMSMVPTSTAPMSDKEAMDHLRELPNAVRLTMKICITGKPEIQKKLEESKDWAEFINTAEVKEYVEKMNLPGSHFSEFVKAYYSIQEVLRIFEFWNFLILYLRHLQSKSLKALGRTKFFGGPLDPVLPPSMRALSTSVTTPPSKHKDEGHK